MDLKKDVICKRRLFTLILHNVSLMRWWKQSTIKTLSEQCPRGKRPDVRPVTRCVETFWAVTSRPLISCHGKSWVQWGVPRLGLAPCGTSASSPPNSGLTPTEEKGKKRLTLFQDTMWVGWQYAIYKNNISFYGNISLLGQTFAKFPRADSLQKYWF